MSRSTTSLASGSGESSSPEKPLEKKEDPSDNEKLTSGPPAGPPRKGPGFNPDLYKPKTAKFWLILLSNFLALFLVALDRTIISTAIPRITDDFKSLGDIGWYGSAYMLTTSASQLLYGRVYKFYDMKWTFMIAIIIFEIGSAICGAAPNSPVFIVGRSIAGLGSAGIFAGGMMIMIPMIPLHKRPMFQGMFGMVFGIASVLGPVVGGAFTGHVSWRWCFYINLPVGAVTMVFLIFFWNPPTQKHEPASISTHIKRLDPLGTFFFLPGIVSLLLALQWGGSTYSWSNGRIIALFIVFGVLIAAFAAVQILKPETATVPPKVITQRSILCGALFTFFLAGAMLMTVYFVPIWFQTVKGVDPLKSGTYTLPLVLSLVASSMLSGLCTQKIGYYVPSMILSPCLMATGEGLMSTFNPHTGSSHWIGYQFLTGFGLGLGMQTGGLAAQTVLPPEDVSTGISIMFFVQQLGGAVFTTVGQSILSNLLVSKLSAVPGLDANTIVANGATELLKFVPAQYIDFVIHAYNYACTRIFLAGMGLSLGSLAAALGMEWKNIKKGKQGLPGGPKDAEAGDEAGPATEPPTQLPVEETAQAKAQETAQEKFEEKEADSVGKEPSDSEQAKEKTASDE